MRNSRFLFMLLFLFAPAPALWAGHYMVKSAAEIKNIQHQVKPGDTVYLANQIWQDAQIELLYKGTEANPIYILPQTTGGVTFTGTSSCKIGGSFLIIDGFLFKDISAKRPVIQFRVDAQTLANHCRVTNTVIDNCNPPDRLMESNWIVLYGRNNRFDHNTILRKKNLGTTLIVELNDTLNQNNYHQIDHNYFGPRNRAGSNGGETIRIGVSTFSKTSSHTLVSENYFDKCNGEVEIISVKSCDNLITRNTFFECEGGLVLRHGNRNTVSENYFIGNNLENTGGVRVINAGHQIKNNFFFALGGDRFRSAFTIMNGVPNSPINRYEPVKDVTIEGNVFIDCNNLEFCGGKDFERTAIPEKVQFNNNLIYNSKGKTHFSVNDDISGISFQNNIGTEITKGLSAKGFSNQPVVYTKTKNGWSINGKSFAVYATTDNCGASWFSPGSIMKPARKGHRIEVLPGENTLLPAVLKAGDGDTVSLSSGMYKLSKTVFINKSITITGAANSHAKPLIQYVGEQGGLSFFSIENGGSLKLSGIRFNGLSDNGTAESFIRTSNGAMIEHYNLFVEGCDFENITDGRKNALKVNKGSFADTIQFINCLFNNISGEVLNIAAEKEDKGIYNAENILISNCVFNKVLVGAIDVYRGGNDESTTGPYFTMDHCTFNEVGNVELCSVVRLIGVQYSKITNCIFNNSGRSGRTVLYEDFGWTKNSISFCNSFRSGKVQSFYANILGKKMLGVNPQFVNLEKGDFNLKSNSLLKKAGNDGNDMGALYINGQLKQSLKL